MVPRRDSNNATRMPSCTAPASGLSPISTTTCRTTFVATAAPMSTSTHGHTRASRVPRAAPRLALPLPRTAAACLAPARPKDSALDLGAAAATAAAITGQARHRGQPRRPYAMHRSIRRRRYPLGAPAPGPGDLTTASSDCLLQSTLRGASPGIRAERPGTAADSGGSSSSGVQVQAPHSSTHSAEGMLSRGAGAGG